MKWPSVRNLNNIIDGGLGIVLGDCLVLYSIALINAVSYAVSDSGGPFSWGVAISNVSDNFAAVVSPWMYRWVEGDGTAKTITVYIANDGAGDLEDDELFLEVTFPSEAGVSMFDYLPNDGAPTDGGGRMQLLGTAAAIGDDTGSTWGGSVGNHQKFTQSIAPDYRGLVSCRVHYSKSGGAVMYIDPKMAIA